MSLTIAPSMSIAKHTTKYIHRILVCQARKPSPDGLALNLPRIISREA